MLTLRGLGSPFPPFSIWYKFPPSWLCTWIQFTKAHNLEQSMSRRGNCHDNAVAESFFQLLKRERVRRRIYANRDEARQDIFDYIEMFYNPNRRHSSSQDVSPVEYDKQYFQRLSSV